MQEGLILISRAGAQLCALSGQTTIADPAGRVGLTELQRGMPRARMLALSADPAAPAVSRPHAVKQCCCWHAGQCCWLHAHSSSSQATGMRCGAPACRPSQCSYQPGQWPGLTISPTLTCAGAGCMPRACMLPTRGESTVVKPEAARAVDLASTSLRLGRSQCRCVAVCITHHMLRLGQGTSNSSMCVRDRAPPAAWLPMWQRKV